MKMQEQKKNNILRETVSSSKSFFNNTFKNEDNCSMNSSNLSNSSIFNKKINNNSKLKIEDKVYIFSNSRHFPPANKEWINSIYTFNKNASKSLPVKDKILFNLVKSYFNLYNKKEEKRINTKHIRMRFRRLSILKIFVSRAEIKHTNYKVFITFYVYNKQKIYLKQKLRKLQNKFIKKLNLSTKRIKKLGRKILIKLTKQQLINSIGSVTSKNNIASYTNDYNVYYRSLIKIYLEKVILTLYIKQLLHFNKSKFEDTYLLSFKNVVEKIYSKDVEFNIVNLKYIYFNSDIFTQSIVLKLKRKKSSILRVLGKFFKLIKIPPLNKVLLINLKKNKLITTNSIDLLDINCNSLKDKINHWLMYIFNESSINNIKKREPQKINGQLTFPYKIEDFVLDSLKHKHISGLRVEAKGRLSRRFTASRSVFKVKYKGSLKNINSSYQGLSTVILRGHAKSNVQYTNINSKTRNGSFGIKGWVSSK